jgi:CubicO group peptidase (beta-lactamase class C family)
LRKISKSCPAIGLKRGLPNAFIEGFYQNLWWGSFRAGRGQGDFYANGHFGQRIYISPDKSLVLIRMRSDANNINWTELLGSIADAWPAKDPNRHQE